MNQPNSKQSKKYDYDLKNVVSSNRLIGLWRLLTGFRWLYFGAILSVGLAAVFRTGFFFLLRYFADDILGNPELQWQLPLVALGFIGLALGQGGFTALGGRWAAASAEGVIVRLRDFLYDHIQRLSYSYHDKTSTGELIQRATSDVDALRLFFADQAIGVGRITLLFLVNFVALLSIDVKLGLVSVIVVPLLIIVSLFFFTKISAQYERFQEQEAILSTTLQENLTGIRVVRAFARQAYEIDKFEGDNYEKYLRGRRLVLMHGSFWPSTDLLIGAQLIAGYIFGAILAIEGTITVGTYLAYLGILGWVLWPMRQLGRLVVQMSTGMVSFGRVLDIIKVDREPLTEGRYAPDAPLTGRVIFDNVSFGYDDGTAVLKDISFSCKPGQKIALVGATGSGKTSLVNLLPRFYEYNSGSITIDGIELRDYTRQYLRRQIGVVHQEPFLFSRTIQENITYGVDRDVKKKEIEDAARAAAVHDVVLNFPEAYRTLVGEKGVTLSGGQKQRLTLARTLLKDPSLLILDDATSSVDTQTEALIRGALQSLMENRTTFIIAHRIQTVMSADLILVLDKGKIVQVGSHEDLVGEDGPYRRVFELQSKIEDDLEEDLATALA